MSVDLPAIVQSGPALTCGEKFRAWLDMWFVDHGFIRSVYCNIHKISNDVWRSAQPGPRHLRWAKRQGIRTILNLRGRRDTCGSYILEREEARRLGLILVDFPIRSRSPLDRETVKAAALIWDQLEYPVMIHCKSGADRAGLMSTLYMFLHQKMPLREAMRTQLSLRLGHLKQAKTGIIDFFFERYLAAEKETGIGFMDWIDQIYDPKRLEAEFRENWLAGIIVDYIFRRE